MRRSIWKEPSAELQKRLSSQGCLKYKRCLDEHEDWWEERCNQGKISDDEYEQSWKKIDEVYECLSDDDKATLDAECEIDSLNDDISSCLCTISMHAGLWGSVTSIETEQQYINNRQLKYIYPEYGQLVGPPSKDDFYEYCVNKQDRPVCNLNREREADLLLLGVFEWKGLYIAKAYRRHDDDPRGWLVCTDPDYVPKDILGAKSIGPYRYQLAFTPFHGVRSQWLHEYLYDCDVELGNREAQRKNQYVTFKDGNPYNCLPDNLILAQKRGRGRPMLCQSCGEETTREDSMVISERSRKARYCLDCLRGMVGGG